MILLSLFCFSALSYRSLNALVVVIAWVADRVNLFSAMDLICVVGLVDLESLSIQCWRIFLSL